MERLVIDLAGSTSSDKPSPAYSDSDECYAGSGSPPASGLPPKMIGLDINEVPLHSLPENPTHQGFRDQSLVSTRFINEESMIVSTGIT
jgi:hypothetical protein